ncbi:hypothetical protein [Marinilabilia salmonicolor]|jgi:hypothetical protein|uniref:Uncharacterized protein n=1 Tax=Marinilabilia salmonicolor TaxID=989 RepID=A0A368UNY5_9BACT|nr:hypothetical protein [Marinilabilia salmonicolor]RCW29104.1 hypothetical protein DFO77_1315 [Marinilabilia salmonicolor]
MAITINIKNKKALSILKSLEDINFIEVEGQVNNVSTEKKDKHKTDKNAFFALQGLWKNRDVDIDVIRNKAWKRK